MLQRKSHLLGGLILGTAGVAVFASRPAPPPPATNEFEEISLTLQVNATDEDIGVMIATEVAEAFLGFAVHDPFDNLILDVRASDPAGMGLTEFLSEATHDSIAAGLAAFPEGTYRLSAVSVSGTVFSGRGQLSHDLPARPRIVVPTDQSVAELDDLVLTWRPDGDVDHYVLELEGDEVDMQLEVPAGTHSFKVPSELLRRGASYMVAVGAVHESGNVVFEEVRVRIAR